MVGQGGRGREGVRGPLVGQRHAHGARGGAEAQRAVVEAAVADGGEAGGRALVQVTAARQGVPSGATATAGVGHWGATQVHEIKYRCLVCVCFSLRGGKEPRVAMTAYYKQLWACSSCEVCEAVGCDIFWCTCFIWTWTKCCLNQVVIFRVKEPPN